MNKTELVASVAEKAELSKKDAEKAVAAMLESVEEALKAGDKVALVGFGTFEVKSVPLAPARIPVLARLSKSPLPAFPYSRPARA